MPEVEEIEPDSKLDKAKEVIKKNWKPFTVGVVLTGVTLVVTRRVFPNQTGILINKMVIKDNVFLIETYARKQGSPSYLIQCIETGKKWLSQLDLAHELGVSPSLISSRFKDGNGAIAAIDGNHYKRVAMAIPRSG